MSAWRAERGVLYTDLNPEKCASRIKDVVDAPYNIFGAAPVMESATARSATLRKRIRYSNSNQTILPCRFEAHGAGTLIRYRSLPALHQRIFQGFWFGFIGLWTVAAIVILAALNDPVAPVLVLGGVFMLGAGAGLVILGRWLARDEHAYLVEFLKHHLDARPR